MTPEEGTSEEKTMGEPRPDPAERIANQLVNYLFDKYQGSRHVRRVATWIGFVLKAIQRASGGSVRRNRSRQVVFAYRDHQFKARYNHRAGARGGIDIVELLPLRGSPDGDVVVSVTSLADAENVYRSLEGYLDRAIAE